MAYTHLTLQVRSYIEMRLHQKDSLNQIARDMGRSQSTLSRELARNKGQRGHRYQQADRKAKQRHAEKPKAIKLTTELAGSITSMLEQQWSPEQISGRLKQQGKASVRHETIYQHILKDKQVGGKLYLHLRRPKKYRKRYGSTTGSRNGIPNRIDIAERPDVVNQRERLVDWEADTMIGKGHQGALVTLDERKSKLRLAPPPLANKTAEAVTSSIIALLGAFKGWVHTLTFDNGKEFAPTHHHAKATNADPAAISGCLHTATA